MAAKLKAVPAKDSGEDYPFIYIDIALGDVKDCINVLNVVAELLAKEEICDEARPAAQILEYATADLTRHIARVEKLAEVARHNDHAFRYPASAA